jgi:hypothetical protein
MRRFLSFWWLCAKEAFRGSAAFANDWQWLFGIPICSGLAFWFSARFGITNFGTGNSITDGVLVAGGAFIVTWLIAFIARLSNAPANLYHREKTRADDLQKQLSVIQPLQIIIGSDGHYDKIYATALQRRYRRVQIGLRNIGDHFLSNCNLYLTSVTFPTHRTFPICLRSNFELNPGQEEYVPIGSYTHFPYLEGHKKDLTIALPEGEGIDSGEIVVKPTEVWKITFEANAKESLPTMVRCRLWVDDKNRWQLEKA